MSGSSASVLGRSRSRGVARRPRTLQARRSSCGCIPSRGSNRGPRTGSGLRTRRGRGRQRRLRRRIGGRGAPSPAARRPGLRAHGAPPRGRAPCQPPAPGAPGERSRMNRRVCVALRPTCMRRRRARRVAPSRPTRSWRGRIADAPTRRGSSSRPHRVHRSPLGCRLPRPRRQLGYRRGLRDASDSQVGAPVAPVDGKPHRFGSPFPSAHTEQRRAGILERVNRASWSREPPTRRPCVVYVEQLRSPRPAGDGSDLERCWRRSRTEEDGRYPASYDPVARRGISLSSSYFDPTIEQR
jgi:hypothetical protein